MKRDEFYEAWSALHGGAQIRGIVKWWLSISFVSARFLTQFRISPNALTLIGVLAAVLTWLTSPGPWAIAWLVFSLACDGVDGTLAMITGKSSRWGATLDATADRIAEAFWVGAFIAVGVSVQSALIIWIAAATQEYVRARAGGLGMRQIGIVTVAERPMRASALCIALVAHNLNLLWAPGIGFVMAVIQVLSCVTVLNFAFQQMSK